MTEQEVDRRCAIYGTILGVVVAAMIVALFWWAVEMADAQTDGSAPPTVITSYVGDLFNGPVEDRPHTHVVQQTPNAQSGVEITGYAGYRWYWYTSGPPSCVYTANYLQGAQHAIDLGHEAHHRLTDVGGGGACTVGNDRATGNNCRFIMPGWKVFAASGGDCGAFGIAECTIGRCH